MNEALDQVRRSRYLLLFTKPGNAQAHCLARLQISWRLLAEAYARRCSGRNDVAGLQAHEPAQVADQKGNLVNHGACIAVLG